MKAVTAEQMREIDRISIDEMGIPEVVLMNNAGRALAEAVSSRYKDVPAIVFSLLSEKFRNRYSCLSLMQEG